MRQLKPRWLDVSRKPRVFFGKSQVSAKLAMVLSLGVLTISNFSLGMLETGVASTSLLRFVSGLAAACPLVYLPLWVDEYAGGPSGGNMSQLLHGTCIGHLFGVVTGSSQTGWRGALVTQSCLLFMVLVGIATVPLVQVDIPSRIQTARLDCLNLQGAESSGVQNLLREMRDMIQGMNRLLASVFFGPSAHVQTKTCLV